MFRLPRLAAKCLLLCLLVPSFTTGCHTLRLIVRCGTLGKYLCLPTSLPLLYCVTVNVVSPVRCAPAAVVRHLLCCGTNCFFRRHAQLYCTASCCLRYPPECHRSMDHMCVLQSVSYPTSTSTSKDDVAAGAMGS